MGDACGCGCVAPNGVDSSFLADESTVWIRPNQNGATHLSPVPVCGAGLFCLKIGYNEKGVEYKVLARYAFYASYKG